MHVLQVIDGGCDGLAVMLNLGIASGFGYDGGGARVVSVVLVTVLRCKNAFGKGLDSGGGRWMVRAVWWQRLD